MTSSQHYLLCFHPLKCLFLAVHGSPPASPTAPLLLEKRQQITSQTPVLARIPPLLRLNSSVCRDCGQRTRAIECGCMSLDCRE